MNPNPFKHVGRYVQIARLLYKYGRSDVVEQSGLGQALRTQMPDYEATSHDWDNTPTQTGAAGDPGPEEFARDLESLGPTFIKLGQLLSTRPDFVSEPYRQALAKLQDDNEPVDIRDVFRVIEEEMGKQPEYLFESFDIEPLATASLGQVHRAKMKDGRDVVVKIQRPEVAIQLSDDLEVMQQLASTCDQLGIAKQLQLSHLVESLKHSLAAEINYRNEAANAVAIANNLEDFEHIVVPQPVHTHTTDRVLTTEFFHGEKLTDLSPNRLSVEQSRDLAQELFRAFLTQVLVHGAFHADPHPGNIFLTPDDRILLLDFGLVVKVSPRLQAHLIKLLMAICEGDGTRAAELAELVGKTGRDFDHDEFRMSIERVVAENVHRTIDQLKAGTALMNIHEAAGKHDLRLPMEVILLGRALMLLEEAVSALDPNFDPSKNIRQQATRIMRKHSGQSMTLSSIYQSLLETTEFAQQLPARANKVAELLANNEIRIKVDALDEAKLIASLKKVANRISAGLIIAAMIVGAALMMPLETTWTILGYPVIAFCFMMFAAFAGGILVWRVVISDNFE